MKLKRIGIILVISLFTMMAGGCSLFKTKIYLENYVSYSYEGISGYTSITLELNTEQIQKDFAEKIGEKKQEDFVKLLHSMSIEASKTESLSNGDAITLQVTYDETLCESVGIKFTGTETEIVIEGLEEGILLDLFADIVVNVQGTAPLAVASVENKSSNEYIKGLTYTLDKTTGFRAGEELVVSCNADKETAKEQGYVFLNTTHVYKTDGVDAYVEAEEEIDFTVLSEVIQEAKNTVIRETEGSQRRMLYKVTGSSNFLFQYNKEWIDSIELLEVKLFTCSDIGQYDKTMPYNKLLVVFKAYVTNADHGSDGYFCFEYDNLMNKGDGSFLLRHDNQELRYLCDNQYDELMERVMQGQPEIYAETQIDINNITITE